MILEKLNKKVNLKKIMYLSSWRLEIERLPGKSWVHGGGGGVGIRADG